MARAAWPGVTPDRSVTCSKCVVLLHIGDVVVTAWVLRLQRGAILTCYSHLKSELQSLNSSPATSGDRSGPASRPSLNSRKDDFLSLSA